MGRVAGRALASGQAPGLLGLSLLWSGVLWLGLLSLAGPARADAVQDLDAMRALAQSWLEEQVAQTHPDAEVDVRGADPRLRLAPCDELEPFLPPGGRLLGRTSVGVRCRAPSRWTLYLVAEVLVREQVLVAARAMARGTLLTPADVELRDEDVSRLTGGVLDDPEQASGRQLLRAVRAGQPLEAGMLRLPDVVHRGRAVQLIARGAGFTVRSEGRALNDAAVGEAVSVRVRSGETVRGRALADGNVEVDY